MTRVEVALADIARRRELAQAATPGPWTAEWNDDYLESDYFDVDGPQGGWVARTNPAIRDAEHIAANDPAHVLAVLDAAEAVLRRHRESTVVLDGCDCEDRDCDRGEPQYAPACQECGYDGQLVPPWPCPDAAAVLDIYAPEATP